MKSTFAKLAVAGLLTIAVTTAVEAFDFGGEGGWGANNCCCCTNSPSGKIYRMPNGNLTNVFPARKAAAAKPKSAPAPKPAKPAAPKPRKKVNFIPKKK